MSKALALALLVAVTSSAMARRPRVDKSMETEGSYSRVKEPGHRVITTTQAWQELWKELGRKPPTADLAKNFAVAVFAGERSSGGYAIEFDAPVRQGKSLVIRYAVRRPKGMAIMALTQPYAIKLFPKIGDSPAVRVEGREE